MNLHPLNLRVWADMEGNLELQMLGPTTACLGPLSLVDPSEWSKPGLLNNGLGSVVLGFPCNTKRQQNKELL